MKKTAAKLIVCGGLLIVLPVLLFYAIMANAYYYKAHSVTPNHFPGSVWESQDPEIHIEVTEGKALGHVQFNGEKTEVILLTNWGSPIWLYEWDPIQGMVNKLLLADAKCSEEKVVMRVKEDNLFDGQYKKITLYRVDVPDHESIETGGP